MTPAALPTIGSIAEDQRREPGDEALWSVTTIIGILDKPALVPWAVGETAEQVVDDVKGLLYRLENDGREETIDWVKRLRWRTDGRLKASDLGTVAHGLFDEYAINGTRPEVVPELHPDFAKDRSLLDERDLHDLRRMLDQFDRFLAEFQPEYLATEVVVYDPKIRPDGSDGFGHAGQADCFLSINGIPLIGDYKTSRKSWTKSGAERGPYPEVGLQLAAYRYSQMAAVWRARRYKSQGRRYYLLSEAEKAAALPVPEVDNGVAIYVTPDRYGVYPVRCGAGQYEAFLYCLEMARWSFNESKHVVGNPMPPQHPIPEPSDNPFAGLSVV